MKQSFVPPAGPMTLKLVKQLVSKMPYLNNVCVMGLCEPFLNPECSEILKYLKSQDFFVSFTTNGTIPLVGERLESLSFVDDLAFSIDTADPETFTYLRGGAKLHVVMENLKRVLNWKRELGLGKDDKPTVYINAVITSANFLQIPQLIEMLEPYADDLRYLMVDPVSRPDYQTFSDPLVLKHDFKFELGLAELRETVKQHKLQVMGLDWILKPSSNWKDCVMSWLDMRVEPNGDAYICCYNYSYVIGNVFNIHPTRFWLGRWMERSPLQIWNSDKAKAFRRQLLTKKPPIQQCHSCNFARSGWQDGTYLKERKDVEA
jgi:MoaA/NifB/PqqE/SkfB family radical SAM enzyme